MTTSIGEHTTSPELETNAFTGAHVHGSCVNDSEVVGGLEVTVVHMVGNALCMRFAVIARVLVIFFLKLICMFSITGIATSPPPLKINNCLSSFYIIYPVYYFGRF